LCLTESANGELVKVIGKEVLITIRDPLTASNKTGVNSAC
jgi:hypothetical protein